MFYSTKPGGYYAPDTLFEIHDFFKTHAPAESGYLDSPEAMAAFAKIYGDVAARTAVQTHKVPENIDKEFVGPGTVYQVGSSDPLPGIPSPGEAPALKRLEAKLDLIISKLDALY